MATVDEVDISDMPAPPPELQAADISDMPTPSDLFKLHVGRDPESDQELEVFKQHPENFGAAQAPGAAEGRAHAKKVAKVITEHPFTATAGLAENALSAVTSGAGNLADAVTFSEPGAHDWAYQPRTEAGQQLAAAGGEESAHIGKGYDETFGEGPLAQTVKERGQETLGAVSTVAPLIKGVGAGAARFGSGAVEAGRISDFGGSASEAARPSPPPTAPTPAVEGPVTAEALRAQPDPLAPAAPAAEQAAPANVSPEASAAPEAPARVPGKPHIKLKASAVPSNPAPEPIAPQKPASAPDRGVSAPIRFTPPSAEGASVGDLPTEHQATRLNTLHHLNELAGNPLGEVRTSALSGNSGETGIDWAHAKVQDLGGKRMQEVIGNETNALRTAADNLVERTGTVAEGVDQPALHRRGTIVSKAISGIESWFDDNIKSMYTTAKERARGIPIEDMTSLKTLAGDESNFAGTTEGEALYRGVQARAKKLGLMGNDGAFKPATVEQAEQFRQYLGEQWTPRTAGLINKLKDALDEDVARHGGADLFAKARGLRAKKGKLLEDPTGIVKLLHPDDRLGINRAVPLNEVPDYIANLDPEQFHHVINVLKSSAHLGDGELAESAAAALREIKGHMAAKLHDAGSSRIQGGWDAKNFYKQLNDYSLKLSSVFSQGELGDWKTVNDASNILRMDRTYKGAKVEEHNVGLSTALRAKAGTLARGGVDVAAHHALPLVGPALTEATGLSERVGRIIGGNPEAKAAAMRLAQVEKRVTKLEPKLGGQPSEVRHTSQTAPLGSSILGGKQRGAVGNLKTEATVNIGLNIGDKQGLTPEQVVKVLKAQGVRVKQQTVHQSNTEPTLVVTLDKPLSSKQASTVSALLKQDAIAQVSGGKGELYGPKAEAWKPFNRDYFLTHEGKPLSANDALFFKHYSDLTGKSIELDPSFYGKGLKGAERTRVAGGAPKVVSAYGMEGEVEPELRNKTEYSIKVPKKEMYDLSADPEGFKQKVRDENSGVYDHSEVERMIKDAGYTGYHLPDGEGIFKGQARFFNKVPATRATPEEPLGARAFGGRQRGAVGNLSKKPGLPTEHLTDTENAQLRKDTTQRVIDAFHDLPPIEEYAAAALAGKAKKGWYENSARAITNMFGPDSPRFSALLAAMSPQTSVQMNFHNALRTFINWDKAGRPTSEAAIKSIMEESSLKSSKSKDSGSNVLHAWVPNAIRALTHPEPENMTLSGPKVNSFMHNLRDNVNEVTNDAWMTSFAKVDPGFVKGRVPTEKNPSGKGPGYVAMSAKVRAAAKLLTQMTGESWTPREVQETVWSWAKTASEHADSFGGLATIPELVKDKEITDELIKSTPDFHQLFSAKEHSGVIGNSRFAGNAERVGSASSGPTVQGPTGKKTASAERTLQPHLQAAARRLEEVRQAAGRQ